MTISPTWIGRIRSARSILFGRGDDAFVCSFCGKDRHEAGNIVAGPGVAICSWCANLALEFSNAASVTADDGKVIDSFYIVEHPFCVLPGFRGEIDGEMAKCARELNCTLVSWAYSCGYGVFSDSLLVRIERPRTTNLDVLRETFIKMLLSGPILAAARPPDQEGIRPEDLNASNDD